MDVPTLVTQRLLLRQWRPADVDAMHAINTDPVVMEHFPTLPSYDETAAAVERFTGALEEGGPGLYAVDVRETGEFVGFTGLAVPSFETAFTPCVEVGWRLAQSAWGNGYATEGANAALAHAFDVLELDEVVSFTAHPNVRSRNVMERLGMTINRAEDFDHPNVADGPLRRHLLARISAGNWRARV